MGPFILACCSSRGQASLKDRRDITTLGGMQSVIFPAFFAWGCWRHKLFDVQPGHRVATMALVRSHPPVIFFIPEDFEPVFALPVHFSRANSSDGLRVRTQYPEADVIRHLLQAIARICGDLGPFALSELSTSTMAQHLRRSERHAEFVRLGVDTPGQPLFQCTVICSAVHLPSWLTSSVPSAILDLPLICTSTAPAAGPVSGLGRRSACFWPCIVTG